MKLTSVMEKLCAPLGTDGWPLGYESIDVPGPCAAVSLGGPRASGSHLGEIASLFADGQHVVPAKARGTVGFRVARCAPGA